MKPTENMSKHMQQNNTIVATITISKQKFKTNIQLATNITNQNTEAKQNNKQKLTTTKPANK
jgi:hypothetical protein